jgi:hypothetical protein
MLRRFNYTGRKKIKQEDVPIQLIGKGPVLEFEADLASIAKYEVPATAKLFVEAYERAAYMRFDFGTVGSISTPPRTERLLTEFEGSDAIRFRVKVVDAGHEGQLLAEADGIFPRTPDETEKDRDSLLPVRSKNLGEEVWAIEFPESSQDRPVLLVNVEVGNRTALVRSPGFMALAWPCILRQILKQILVIDEHSDLDDDADWHCLWLRFGRNLLPSNANPPNKAEDASDWIEDVVRVFCEKYKLMSHFKEVEEAYGVSA